MSPSRDLSGTCGREEHRTCGHRMGVSRSRGSRIRFAVLCRCSCHDLCEVGGVARVRQDEWFDKCNCPGAEAMKKHLLKTRDEVDNSVDAGSDLHAVVEVIGNIIRAARKKDEGILDFNDTVLNPIMGVPPQFTVFKSLALCAATVRWASRETGRPEETILQEIEHLREV